MIWETVRLSLRSIRRNVLRSFLTLLGIVIGVAAVIAMLTIGSGTTEKVKADISKLGSNLLVVRAGRPARTTRRLLPSLEISALTFSVVPEPMVSMAMTAATPMTMPSSVRKERSTLRRIERSERRTVSQIMPLPPLSTCRRRHGRRGNEWCGRHNPRRRPRA